MSRMNVESRNNIDIDINTKKELQQLKKGIDIKETPDKNIFVAAVAEALKNITDLKKIPKGGIPLIYKGQPKLPMPKTIDFFPKQISSKGIPYSIIEIGTKMFKITPSVGKINKITINKKSYHVEVDGMSIDKNIEKEMGEYLWKLNTKGESGFYPLSSVKIIEGNTEKERIRKEIEALGLGYLQPTK